MTCFIGALLLQPIHAADLRWLQYSPSRFFTEKDWELAKSAARQALNEAKDRETVTWANPDTKSHGSLTPTSTNHKNGTKCRSLKIENHAKNISSGAVYRFCQQKDGKWKADSVVPEGK
jgi:surface antigen